mgnify:CR=1 FL=1
MGGTNDKINEEDEKNGSLIEVNNNILPADKGHYLNIKLCHLKNNIFIPNKIDLERFQRDILKRHNYYRKCHQSGPLKLTQKLNYYAQQYAETLAARDTMHHSSDTALEKIHGDWTGENIYYFWDKNFNASINGADIVDSWYDENEAYDYQSGTSKKEAVTGHFTQVVWKESTELGVGVAKSSNSSIYVVANYHPGGNFNNLEKDNVKYFGDIVLDELSGDEVESYNREIPGDIGHYLNIPLSSFKNNVFIPNKKDLERFQRDALKRHNYYRKYHQSDPLKLSQDLNNYAQQYAEKLAAKDTMLYSYNSELKILFQDGVGENFYFFWSADDDLYINGAEVVDNWYDENKYYDFEKGCSKNESVVEHFTQLIWKNSTQFGIGIAKSRNNSVYIVANYNPKGNINGKNLKNVFPLKVL